MFRRLVACVVAGVMVAATASCSVVGPRLARWRMLAEGEARLGPDVAMAVYVSPPSREFGAPGYVLLIDTAGEVSAIETAGMDAALLTWTAEGIFFSDEERDYLLSESGLTTWDSPKANMQSSVFAKPDGTGYVSVYNEGFADPDTEGMGYIEQVVETTADRVTRYDVAGYSTLTAWCGSALYSAFEVTEPYVGRAGAEGAVEREVGPYWPDMLTQRYPRPDSPAEAFRSVRLGGYGGYARDPVCRAGRILAITSDQGDTPPLVVEWPTDGGRPVERVLVGPGDERLALDPEAAGWTGRIASWAPDEHQVVWHGGDGVVRSTDITTGRTRELWDSGTEPITSGYDDVVFEGANIYVFDTDDPVSPDRAMRLRAHDLRTGRTRDVLTTRPRFETVGPTLVQRGIAVRPGL
ncbi:hypothetical protein [Propionicicella superfundia]|uniref:hypothetical protein n=1 Tax=Propionicicella superfundia TaxID=348582 RepID=UPI0004089A22|nr:hypothetical protein [Propionicicella superfundia]